MKTASRFSTLIIVGVLSIGLIMSAVPSAFAMPMGSGSGQASAASAGPYDGETLFRGMFLDDGPVAQLFPEVWNDSRLVRYREQVEQLLTPQQMEQQRQHLLAILNAQDPTFLARFASAMQSGDRIRIDAMMTETKGRLVSAVETVTSSPNILPVPPQISNYRILVTQLYAFGFGYVAVAVFAAVIIGPVFGAETNASISSPGLQQDQYTEMIAERLKAAS